MHVIHIHYWDYATAKIASIASVKAKMRKGWKLCPIGVPYGSWGGISEYTHVLIDMSDSSFNLKENAFDNRRTNTSSTSTNKSSMVPNDLEHGYYRVTKKTVDAVSPVVFSRMVEIDHDVVLLNVPFEEKDQAKKQGAE